jgi:hypothetical protein
MKTMAVKLRICMFVIGIKHVKVSGANFYDQKLLARKYVPKFH